jgi:hypothetical protein
LIASQKLGIGALQLSNSADRGYLGPEHGWKKLSQHPHMPNFHAGCFQAPLELDRALSFFLT